MGLRLAAAAALLALVPAGAASASPARTHGRVPDWAGPQIRLITERGLMGAWHPESFRPNAVLTEQALANLAFGLGTVLAPPAPPAAPVPVAPSPSTPSPSTRRPAVPRRPIP